MEKFGSDKPDLRFNLEMKTLNSIFSNTGFKVFKDLLITKELSLDLLASGCGDYTRNQLDVLTDFVKGHGAKGLIWIRVKDGELESPTMKFFADEEKKNLVESLGAKPGDLIFILIWSKTKNT